MKSFVLQSIFFLLGASTLLAQTINATQTDALTIDNGVPAKADPGDKIRYTIIVSETGNTTNATGVQVTVTPDALTTLVGGSFKTSPVAVNDGTYDCIGNVGITVPAASGVKVNDFDDNLAGATLSCGTCTSANGGTVTIANDGSFTYLPAAGFTGTDNFTYTITDVTQAGPGTPTTDMATVTINVTGMIWFVDENQGSNGSGRLGAPFNTLPNFVGGAADDPGDNIFLYSSGDSYAGGITLLNNQKLIGQGATVSLATATGLTVPTHSNTLPATNGTRPTVVNATAGGDGITLASGNTIRGLNLGNCADFAIDDNGSVGTLTISEVDINTTGGAFQTDAGGTLAVTFGSVTSSGGSRGIYLNTTGGSFTVTGATSCTNPLNQGIRITSTSTNVSFAAITIGNTGSGSEAMELNAHTGTFMASGTTTINSPAAGGGISLRIVGGSGNITFAAIDINGRRAEGIDISSGTRDITTGAVDIDNANSISGSSAIDISNVTSGTISFGTTTINSNATSARPIGLINVNAAVSFASGSAVSNSTVSEIDIFSGNGTFTYNGTVNSTAGICVTVGNRTGGTASFTGNITANGGSTGILLSQNTGGTIIFSGASKSLTNLTTVGVNMFDCANTTVNFTNGGLVINNTGTALGIQATTSSGTGTLTVEGTGNTITTVSGNALNISSVNAGANGVTFASIISTSGQVATITTSTGTKTLGRISTSSSGTTALNLVSAGTVNVGDASASTLTTSTANCVVLNTTTLNLSGVGLDVTATGSGMGVNCTGGTVSITGGNLNIITASGTGFNATSGTVSLTGSNNTINSTSATALNVANTTIGASGLNFQRIDSGNTTAASDPVNGIVLDNTGSSGGLTVTGNSSGLGGGQVIVNPVGTAATIVAPVVGDLTGGTITNTTGRGIVLTNTMNVSLTRMLVRDATLSGIYGDALNGFSLISSWVESNGTSTLAEESGLEFVNLSGTINATNSTISNSFEHSINWQPTSGTATFNVTGSTVGPNPVGSGANGFHFNNTTGTVNSTIVITGSNFAGNQATGISANVEGTSTQNIKVASTTIQDNNIAININSGSSADTYLHVTNNTLLFHDNFAIGLVPISTSTTASQFHALITGNAIGNGTVDSGSRDAYGIRGDFRGDVDAVIAITNNTIRNTDIEGIFVEGRLDNAAAGTPLLDITIRNNTVGIPDDNSAFPFFTIYGMRLESRNGFTVTADVANNDATGLGGFEDIRFRQRDASIFRFERLSDGDGTPNEVITNMATVEAQMIADNPGNTADATNQTAGVTGYTELATSPGATRDPVLPASIFP